MVQAKKPFFLFLSKLLSMPCSGEIYLGRVLHVYLRVYLKVLFNLFTFRVLLIFKVFFTFEKFFTSVVLITVQCTCVLLFNFVALFTCVVLITFEV